MPGGDPQPDNEAPTQAPESLPTLGRFRLMRELGAGGMGRVYLDYDEDLREHVALKVIRPEYTSSAEAEERFKRELAVARLVSHRNVIRIHDMGIDGVTRYISMAYVDGEDLGHLISRGLLPIDQVLSIAIQVCEGLAAAHEAGVVHRDLKPANVMVDRSGRAFVMDFGLAQAFGAPTLSAPGVVVGTVDYMSPEQARGHAADGRSDIYAFGMILFQLLSGRLPVLGDTPMARLTARLHSEPADIHAARTGLPLELGAIVRRCLAVDPADRFQTAAEVSKALSGPRGAQAVAPRRAWTSRRTTAAITLAALALSVALVVWRFERLSNAIDVQQHVIAALPFQNASAEPALDWVGRAIADITLARLGDTSSVRGVSRERTAQLLRDLRVAPSALASEVTARRVREFTSADHVLYGEYDVTGDRLRVAATLRRGSTGELVALPPHSATLDEIEPLAERLADSLSAALGIQPSALPSTAPPAPAARLYREGVELTHERKYRDAVDRLTRATVLDERFAQAWSALAAAYAGLRQDRDAASASRRGAELAGALPPRERFRILARHAVFQGDTRQAADIYEQWLKDVPHDLDARVALAAAHEALGSFGPARREFGAVLAEDPQHIDALLGSARTAIGSGAPQDAIDPLTRALSLAVRLDSDPQRAAAQQALGVAYKRLNRPLDALRAYEQALTLRRQLGLKAGTAASLTEIGQIQRRLGKPDESARSFTEALTIRRELGDRAGESNILNDVAVTLLDRGEVRESIQLFTDALALARTLGNQANESMFLNNIGQSHLELGEFQTATLFLERSLEISRRLKLPTRVTQTLTNLGAGAAAVGNYPLAIRHLGEALELLRAEPGEPAVGEASYQLSLAYEGQGKLQDSLKAAREAWSTVRTTTHDPVYPLAAARYAVARALVGDCADLSPMLEDAVTITRTAGYPHDLTIVLSASAEVATVCGNTELASRTAMEAATIAPRSSNPSLIARAWLQVARASNVTNRATEAMKAASQASAGADRFGLLPISADASIELADAANDLRRHEQARRAAERALAIADRTESSVQLARANFALSVALRALGRTSEAARRLDESQRSLAALRVSAQSDGVMKRFDLRRITARP